jgi:DNA-directed RNA polymerase
MLPDVLQNWAEHLSIALIVAVVIGLTYEYTSHLFREEILKNLLHESQEQVYQALKAYSVLTPDEVFRLLKEIASQINQTLLCFIHLDRKATNARLQKIWIFSTRLSK